MTKNRKVIIIIVSAILVPIIILAAVFAGFYFGCDPQRYAVKAPEPSRSLTHTLTRAEALEDLEYVKDMILKTHYSAVDYVPSYDFSLAYTVEKDNLAKLITVGELWQAVGRILNSLNDGHAVTGFMSAERHSHGTEVKVDNDGKMFVVISGTQYELAAINGVSVADIMEAAKKQYSYENVYRLYKQVQDSLRYAEDMVLLGLRYKTDNITFSYLDGTEKEYTVKYNKVGAVSPSRTEYVDYEIDEARSVGVLSVYQCIYDDVYKTALKDFFTEVKDKGIKKVAVDLSQNYGGSLQCIDEFLKYLDVKEYGKFGVYFRYGDLNIEVDRRTKKNKIKKDLAYGGSVYVITSRETFGTAAMFTTMIVDNGLGEVVGQPMGGAPSTYGDVLQMQMPNSKLLFNSTWKYFFRPGSGYSDTSTIMPDYVTDNPLKRTYELR